MSWLNPACWSRMEQRCGSGTRSPAGRRKIAIPGHRVQAIHAGILGVLRDSGCEDHARLAFHAEAAGDGPAALHHATLAGRRAVELSSHREAAAQYERALRFAGDEPSAALAARYDDLADELRLIDSLAAAADAYERALELWREAGDRLREGDTLSRSAATLWRLCRGREAAAVSADALRILAPLGPTVELANAYVSVAGDAIVDRRFSDANALARQAREIAGQLGSYQVQSSALTVEASAVWSAGGEWEALLRQALTEALDHGAAPAAGFAYTNLHELNCRSRRYAESWQYYLDGVAYCAEHDLAIYLCCLQGVRAATLDRLGRWDESVALSGEVLRRVLASSVNRMIPLETLGRIRARRREPGAWECLDEAMAAADGTGDPEYVVPARLSRAEAYWLAGELAAARHEAELADQVIGWRRPLAARRGGHLAAPHRIRPRSAARARRALPAPARR